MGSSLHSDPYFGYSEYQAPYSFWSSPKGSTFWRQLRQRGHQRRQKPTCSIQSLDNLRGLGFKGLEFRA